MSFIKHNRVNWKPSSTGKNPIDRLIYIINQNTLSGKNEAYRFHKLYVIAASAQQIMSCRIVVINYVAI